MQLWLAIAFVAMPAALHISLEGPVLRRPQRALLLRRHAKQAQPGFLYNSNYGGAGATPGVTTTGFVLGFGTTMTPLMTTTAQGDETWRLFVTGGGTTTPMPASLTQPLPPPCNFTRDERGIIRPLDCSSAERGNTKAVAVWSCHQVRLFSELRGCYPPTVTPCRAALGMNQQRYKNGGDEYEHGAKRNISCAEGTAPIDASIPLTTWGETWYPGRTVAYTECVMGQWTDLTWKEWGATKPVNLLCVAKDTIKLLREVDHLLKWSEQMKQETLARNYTWIDSGANLRMGGLTNAMDNAKRFLAETLTGKIAPNFALQATIDAMQEFRMVPHGVPHRQDTCKDFEKHFLWQLQKTHDGLAFPNHIPPINSTLGFPSAADVKIEQAVSFTCNFAVQKTGVGYDPILRKTIFAYRDGCFCDSKWPMQCPFELQMTPNFKAFGFDALDSKAISTAPGAASNALCWYWSKSDHPEWGYLPTPAGTAFQSPPKNASDLLRATNEKKRDAQ